MRPKTWRPATLARLFGVALFPDDDALRVELRTPGGPDGGSDDDPPIRQRLPDKIAPLGHRGGVPSRRPFLTLRCHDRRSRDCRRYAVQPSQLGAKLGDALVQRRHSDVITLQRDLLPTEPPGQLVGEVLTDQCKDLLAAEAQLYTPGTPKDVDEVVN